MQQLTETTTRHIMGWSEFGRLCTKLYNDIWSLNLDGIVGIGRGGIMIAAYLAHKMDVPLYTIFVRHIDRGTDTAVIVQDSGTLQHFKGSSIILVDDWMVHGRAMHLVQDRIPDFVSIRTLAMVCNPDANHPPDYVGVYSRDEVHFPYDW